MPEESTTPDLVEMTRSHVEAANRHDLDAFMSAFASDAVYDASRDGVGVYEGVASLSGWCQCSWRTSIVPWPRGTRRARRGSCWRGRLSSVGYRLLRQSAEGRLNPASVLALVKNYVVEVMLYDAPPTGVGEADPGEDEPQDRAQEETDKAPIVSIFEVVASKL
jgi:hypothetical protein